MYFRSQKKSSQDVSLPAFIDTEAEGAALSLMDVVSDDEDMMETLSTREQVRQLCRLVSTELTEQERQVICLRYGLGGNKASRQREVADRLGISRSYVSHLGYCKQ